MTNKWTVVIEITDDAVNSEDCNDATLTRGDIEAAISEYLSNAFDSTAKFQIMEIIEAPYGPQHPNGVFLDERHTPKPKKPGLQGWKPTGRRP